MCVCVCVVVAVVCMKAHKMYMCGKNNVKKKKKKKQTNKNNNNPKQTHTLSDSQFAVKYVFSGMYCLSFVVLHAVVTAVLCADVLLSWLI